MKQFLSKLSEFFKQLFSPETLEILRKIVFVKICRPVKRWFSSAEGKRVKQLLSSKYGKLAILIFSLILVLIIGLTRCSANREAPELPVGNVSIEALNVYKKTNVTSTVLGQLPYDLEVEILEEKTVGATTWGRVDQIVLPDGTTVKAGWIDLHYVNFYSDEEALEYIPDLEIEPEIEPEINHVTVNMGTITADKLNIRKGPDSKQDTNGAYYKGDRGEIIETQQTDDTLWGRTNQGWIGMGYVRMDGVSVPSSVQNDESTTSTINTDGNSTVLGYGIVNIRELNVRRGPGVAYASLRKISAGNRYAYYQLQDGWARIEDGWVSTEHFYTEGAVTSKAFTAEVTTDDLNIRRGPYTGYSSVGTYKKGDIVEVLNQINNWGYTENGWIFLDYVTRYYSTGSAIVTSGLNIRMEPSTDAEAVGTYTTGDRVTIVEINGSWGRTDRGWIHLGSVVYDTSPLASTVAETVPATT